MPYISQEERALLWEWSRYLWIPTTPGTLNFVLTKMIQVYLGQGPDYTRYNDVLGVLSAISHELYRREIAPYEDEKIEENGDVYR